MMSPSRPSVPGARCFLSGAFTFLYDSHAPGFTNTYACAPESVSHAARMMGKSALWFTTLRPHWLTTCSPAATRAAAAKKSDIWWNTSHDDAPYQNRIIGEPLFSSSFSYFGLLMRSRRAANTGAPPPLYSPFANTRTWRVFAPTLAQGLCENKTLIYKANFSPSAPALWEVA